MLVAGAAAPPAAPLPDPSGLPAQRTLPDPVMMRSGRRVDTIAQWTNERRPELMELFAHYMYGAIPPKPARMQTTRQGQYRDFLGGQATLRLVTLEAGPTNAPRIELMLVIPNERRGPAPVFLTMDFCGNHALTPDPRVPLARTWLRDSCPGCTNGAATPAARGTQAPDWPLAEIVRRGYGLAAFYSGDIDSDRADRSTGLYAWLADGDPARNNPTNRGTLAAWAWGYHRCVDYLVTDPEVDARRIAALGHSRNGKTALLAAAFDERIAIAFPHQAGCGGSAPSRPIGERGESVKAINEHFPHWFNAAFKQFNAQPERLPFDQNCLVALCAPRPVLFSAADADQWSCPRGQFAVLQAADPAYRLFGVEGFTAPALDPGSPSSLPPLGRLLGGRLGYYLRPGKHSMTPADWTVFMDFADRQWGKPGAR
jgi:hypothetical protein